jgi:hypothetical protein
MTDTKTIIVAFNENDPCDSIAFHNKAELKGWIMENIRSHDEWSTRAQYVYDNWSTHASEMSYSEWIEDMPICDILFVCEYFDYYAIEEIDIWKGK